MSGYEIEELARIEAALDDLVSPTSEDVFQATRPFDERAIASVAATRAGGGGGGSQTVTDGVTSVEATTVQFPARSVSADGGGVALVDFPVYKITVPLTDDQIKALPTSAVELIAAPGTGKVITPLAGFALLDATSGLYHSAGANAAWQLWYGPAGPVGSLVTESSGLVTPVQGGDGGTIGDLGDVLSFTFPVPLVGIGSGAFVGYLVNSEKLVPEDQSLCIADNFWGLSDYTDGDPANRMDVTVVYAIIDLPT